METDEVRKMIITLKEPYKTIADKINKISNQNGYKCYLVGGFVRDVIMGVSSPDLDFIIDKEGDDNPATTFVNLLETQNIGDKTALYENFGTAKIEVDGFKIEFVMPRGEKYIEGSRNPVVEKVDLKGDAIRRDFTVNTLMLNLDTYEVIDPTNRGIHDIENKILHSAKPDVNQMFIDDPLRLLRAVRFSACKGFEIGEGLKTGIIINAARIKDISQERIREELDKILMAVDGEEIWNSTVMLALVPHFLPELFALIACKESEPYHWIESTYRHTIRSVYNCPPNLDIRRAALFHDIGKPKTHTIDENGKAHFYGHEIEGIKITEQIMSRLTYSNEDIKKVVLLVKYHMRPHLYHEEGKYAWSDKAVRKFIIETGDLLNLVLDLAEADSMGSSAEERVIENLDRINSLKTRISKIKDKLIIKKPIINGDKLKEIYGKPSGEWIGEIIRYQMEILYETPEISVGELEYKILQKFPKEEVK